MNEVGIALVALGVGVVVGTVVALRYRLADRPTGVGSDRSVVLEGKLDAQSAELRRLADGARAQDAEDARLHQELRAARQAVEALRIRDEERRGREAEHAEVVRRLSTVLAGGSAKGRAGENVLREHLAELPPGMLVSDFRVNGKVVEYGLLLPDGRRLPIDSKWPAVRELEALEAATDPAERDLLAREVERVVAGRAREVAAYLDPSITAPVAVAAIPDAAYRVLRRAHAEAFSRGVVIVPYSSALPVLLFLHSLVARYGSVGDVEGCLTELTTLLEVMESVLENKLTRAATMLANGADEFRAQLGKARGSIARARASGLDTPDTARLWGGDAAELLRAVD
ncbi:MAG: DNA recombination protein RmuC [Actinomycetota bacterium]|nr:DNA recombination protein RmuC [Actinomycetota bacterium]